MTSTNIKIGPYIIQQTLGVGSFGKVKMATHSLTGHKVALKIINRKKLATTDMVGRVKREIQYLKLLRHPHIIKLYEVITTPTDIIMVIEYAGGELFNYIVDNGKMMEDVARRFFQQIICAVEYCHRHKIVHRDLKPENLLLDPYNNVKIADFGLSNIMTDGDFLKTSCGSPNYAAPEVISGKLYAGPEVDVWSCGVILFVLLCGRLPFDDESIPLLFKKITGGIYSIPHYVSSDARNLLSSMLVVDPLKRITIPEIRKHPWFTINLPDYLRPLPTLDDDPFENPDESIIRQLQKMGFSKESVIRDLQKRGNNQTKVAYQLALDNQRMLMDVKNSKDPSAQNYLLCTSPPSWSESSMLSQSQTLHSSDGSSDNVQDMQDSGSDYRSDLSSSISILSSSLPRTNAVDILHGRSHRSVSNPVKPTSFWGAADESKPHYLDISTSDKTTIQRVQRPPRSRWHFGIRSRSPPLEVMFEIYQALKKLGMQWKTLDPFNVRCQYLYPDGHMVKIDLQLYKIDSNSTSHNYLVDFKNVLNKSSDHTAQKGSSSMHQPSGKQEVNNGTSDEANHPDSDFVLDQVDLPYKPSSEPIYSSFPFFDVCAKLITELAVSG
ncbi:Pkinase-domain-containing protein [Basidiobolus meristosporus CBS 931.73]|uniref:non-specific serine/threonine protein kinase n=1 Tax=Basidiobolus meristosporus CBS 931.73 TaxID=1314790 RepID=A0A1Y1Y8D2_9FUNG|nr:Pkinase-domain-containing protein [Basidiobolus meristosporus CBS 931.73]|eukprot:ORX94238.1 Pkinase-domain-containing protein [Basidiobolus meristosporus CBS 931.73]